MNGILKIRMAAYVLVLVVVGSGFVFGQDVTVKQGGLTASKFVDESLVGYWQFSGNADDSSIYGNYGTPQNGATVSKDVVELDGSNDYVTCGSGSSLGLSEKMSVVAWIKSGTTSGYQFIVNRYTYPKGWYLAITPYRLLCFIVCDPDWRGVVSSTAIPTNKWTCVACTYQKNTGGGMRLYINGVYNNSYHTGTSGIVYETSKDVRIGCQSGSLSYPFKGSTDEVMIFNRVLEPWEI